MTVKRNYFGCAVGQLHADFMLGIFPDFIREFSNLSTLHGQNIRL